MDPLALAQLPLATLVLAAIVWALVQVFRYATERYDDARARTALHNRFLLHAGYTRGNLLAALSVTVQELERISGLTGGLPPDPNAPPAPEPDPEPAPAPQPISFWERIFGSTTAPTPKATKQIANLIATNADFTVTQGVMNSEEFAKALDQFEPDVAGLVLFLLEEQPMARELLKKANAANDTADTVEDYVGALLGLQFSFLNSAIAAKAISDKSFRAEVSKIVRLRTENPTLAAQKLFDLARREMTGIDTLYTWTGSDDEPGFQVVPLVIMPETAMQFQVETFSVVNQKPKTSSWFRHYGLPIVLTLAIGVTAFYPPLRDFVFPPDPATCSTKITADGAVETTCSFTAPTLPGAIEVVDAVRGPVPKTDTPTGQPAPTPSTAPETQPAQNDASTATGSDGNVIVLPSTGTD